MRLTIRHTFVFAGLVLFPATGIPLDHKELPPADPRLVKLRQFFLDRASPILHLAEDFIEAADQNGLDWRLLPSIAMVESSGAKYYHNNNIFGWDNGDLRFRSIHSSIHEIARYMSSMRCYRGRDLDGVLWNYNPIAGYSDRIKSAMLSIDPDFRVTHRAMLPEGGVVAPPSPLRN